MKKILWTLVILILVAGVAFGAYWYFEQQQRGGTENGTLSIGDLFPFGQGSTQPDIVVPAPIISTSTAPTPAPVARVWKISREPQAGAGIFLRNGDAFVRFVDTATGNIFENKLGAGAVERVSNTTVPKIREALWAQKGDSVILRYVSDSDAIQTLHAKIVAMNPAGGGATSTEPSVQELDGSFLASNIIDLSVFTPKDRIFYTTENSAGMTVAFTSNIDGTKPVRLFDSAIREWSVAWPKEDTAVITTKPSGLAVGFSYLVSTKTGAMQALLGNIRGLSTLVSPDATRAIYSESTGGTSRLHSYNIKKNADGILTNTLAEKCVWMKDNLNVICAVPKNFPGGIYPDDWYKGKVSFADTFVMYNTDTNRSMAIVDPTPIARENIDATHLALDVSEQFLTFTNKKDGSLWALRINSN